MADFAKEASLLARYPLIAGVDEVGRGPWAGPVTAAAVVLNPDAIPDGLTDSKKLTAKRREDLTQDIKKTSVWGLAHVSVAEIDQLNILQASLLAMRRAIAALPENPDYLLIDGNKIPTDLPCPAEAIVKGDLHVASISAASIIAKTERDALMVSLAQQFPGYGWERNAGYGTKMHQDALQNLGVTPEHRRSFKPIRNML